MYRLIRTIDKIYIFDSSWLIHFNEIRLYANCHVLYHELFDITALHSRISIKKHVYIILIIYLIHT